MHLCFKCGGCAEWERLWVCEYDSGPAQPWSSHPPTMRTLNLKPPGAPTAKADQTQPRQVVATTVTEHKKYAIEARAHNCATTVMSKRPMRDPRGGAQRGLRPPPQRK